MMHVRQREGELSREGEWGEKQGRSTATSGTDLPLEGGSPTDKATTAAPSSAEQHLPHKQQRHRPSPASRPPDLRPPHASNALQTVADAEAVAADVVAVRSRAAPLPRGRHRRHSITALAASPPPSVPSYHGSDQSFQRLGWRVEPREAAQPVLLQGLARGLSHDWAERHRVEAGYEPDRRRRCRGIRDVPLPREEARPQQALRHHRHRVAPPPP